MKYCAIILIGLAVPLNAYLILQMRKGNNTEADVDTLIHKTDGSNRKSMATRMRAQGQGGNPTQEERSERRSDLRLGLDTGARRETSGVSQIMEMLSDAFDRYFHQPQSRNVKRIQFNDGAETKRSLALELKSESILHSVEDFLASPKVKQAASDLARKAAIVYRAIEEAL